MEVAVSRQWGFRTCGLNGLEDFLDRTERSSLALIPSVQTQAPSYDRSQCDSSGGVIDGSRHVPGDLIASRPLRLRWTEY